MQRDASGVRPAKHSEPVQRADLLFERVLDALGDRSGYYVIAEAKRGPFSADAAYSLWEEEMQGEVLYMRNGRLFYPDGTPAR